MNKKIGSLFLIIILIVCCFSACNTDTGNKKSRDKLNVVCTVFPQYDWVRQILGDELDQVELTLLMSNGVDLHNYQPTTDDIVKISNCDLFIYVGGDSDDWVEDVLKTANNQDMQVINLLDVLGDDIKAEEIIEGMEHVHEDFDPDNVHDRPLSDWKGDWITIENTLSNGELNEYITHQAEANGMDFETQKAAYYERWKSDYETLEITESSVSFGDTTSNYNYIGYKIVEGSHGASVWYGFGSDGENVPKYIAFSDHNIGGEGHDHDDVYSEAAHYHLRYGDESFDALVETENENWAPTFFHTNVTGEEIAEAMSNHGHSPSEDGAEHDYEFDEHVWLSLSNASIFCTKICNALSTLDEENAAIYQSNLSVYKESIDALDGEYKDVIQKATYETVLFADRFPFRYLVDDYGLSYYAAFSGCSAEMEASFETITFLANKVDKLMLPAVFVIESSDQNVAKTVINNTKNKDQDILILDSLQSITQNDIDNGKTYLDVMAENLTVLKTGIQ